MIAPSVPDRSALQLSYEKLQWNPDTVAKFETANLCRWAVWARLDARLAQIIVEFCAGHFRKINPIDLRETNLEMGHGQALAVLLEFSKRRVLETQSLEQFKTFEIWRKAVVTRLPKTAPQMFFVQDGQPHPGRDQSEIAKTAQAYSKWGFYGTEAIGLSKSNNQTVTRTLLSSGERALILKNLLKTKRSFTITDYMRACGGHVHRRTAQRDLLNVDSVISSGRTRSRHYRK